MAASLGLISSKEPPPARLHPLNWANPLSLTFSLVSLIIAGFALWYSSLKPADIKVSLGSPEFQYQDAGPDEPVQFPSGLTAVRHKKMLALIGTCAIANGGANSGEIDQIAVQFTSDDGAKWTFLPLYILDDAHTITNALGHRVIDVGQAPAFSPIVTPGKQAVRHTFLFASGDFDNLGLHSFSVKLLTWSPDDLKPREQQVLHIDFNSNVVSVLQNQNITEVPWEEARRRLKDLK